MTDFNAHRHPVLAVPCPDCRARAGAWCKRPSGHKAIDLHKARRDAADLEWEAQGKPEIVRRTDPGLDAGAATAEKAAMTAEEFAALLKELGLPQVELARRLTEAGGSPVAPTTIWRYASGKSAVPGGVAAYLRLLKTARAAGLSV